MLIRPRIALPSLALVLATACSSPQQQQDPLYVGVEADPIEQVKEWATGRKSRLAPGTGRADTALVLSSAATGQRTGQLTGCMKIADALPGPPTSRRVFLIIGGALHVLDLAASEGQDASPTPPTQVTGTPDHLLFAQLLFFDRRPQPTTLYSMMQAPSGRDRQLWSFVINGREATGTRVRDTRAWQDQKTFFERFYVPRCRRDGTDCLVPTFDGSNTALDVEATAGAPRRPLGAPVAGDVRAASWHPDDRDSVLLLVTCQQQPQP